MTQQKNQIKCYCGHTTYCDCSPIDEIPTADQILKNHLIAYLSEGKTGSQERADAINEAMVEFAKLHVTKALSQANKKVRVRRHIDGNETLIVDNQNDILQSYPLTNIK